VKEFRSWHRAANANSGVYSVNLLSRKSRNKNSGEAIWQMLLTGAGRQIAPVF